jgi:hypothetical protein
MLLNLSNHPSEDWSPEQKQAVNQKYGNIQDMPFPQINPHWTTEQVIEIARQYCNDIIKINPQPAAVHLMGELTFTFALVTKLKSAGIPCIASTTERIIKFEQDGTKHSTFRFVRFRHY